jgi:predicted amino acid dehydrogenase
MTGLIRSGGSTTGMVRDLVRKLLPQKHPALLETETTANGRSGLVFLPYFADELTAIPKGELLDSIEQAIQICIKHGASCISLAGNLPALTNYGYDVLTRIKTADDTSIWPVITTGHSCTVVAVVKTLQKALEKLQLNLENLTLGIAGFGSIGQASLNLLLREAGKPRDLIIADLASQMQSLRKPIKELSLQYNGPIELVEVEHAIPEAFYRADLIIGASSNGRVMDVDKLRPGTIVLDDSFPHIIDPTKAIRRMKKLRDVIVAGAGKIDMGEKQRQLMFTAIPKALIERATAKLGDQGMPGCRAESLLISLDREMSPTIGLVTDDSAQRYWEKAAIQQMEAVELHLQAYIIENKVIENVRHIKSMR